MNSVVLWRPVKGYEGLYEISNTGEVKSIYYNKKPKILKKSMTTTGYYKVGLWKNKRKKSLRVHKLVAKAFIPNPENKPNINHIDGNPLNNHRGNLEWCTQQENVIHAIKIGLKQKFYIPKSKLKQLYINERKSMKEIGDMYGVSNTVIADRLKEYDIEIRTISQAKNEYGLTKEIILSELKNKSQTQLAKEIGCDQSLISHYVRRIKEKGRLYG